jgi:hypothetical protein
MKLLPTLTPLDAVDARISYGGLVDCETACAHDVALWCDAEIIASIERANIRGRPERTRGSHAA